MSIKATPSFALKDQLFNARSLARLSARLDQAYPAFPRKRFERKVLERFPELELKQRIAWIVTALEDVLPRDFPAALDVLYRVLPEPLDPTLTDDDFGEFIWVVPGEYVARHGCSAAHLDASLSFLRESTKRFSAEYAIRPFLAAFPQQTLAFVHRCVDDPNYHVRRWTSEGIRPLLPWAPRVNLAPTDVVDVLDRLHADSTRYVTRSVANALNDVSKLDPALALDAVRRWHGQGRQQPGELQWMIRHALRTLAKRDHGEALELLGFPAQPRFRLSAVSASDTVRVGGVFEWCCTLTSRAAQRLRVALRIHFLKANGRHLPKVFSITEADVGPREPLEIRKRLPLKPATTRTLYPGTHFAELVVNGVSCGRRPFGLLAWNCFLMAFQYHAAVEA